MKTAGLVILTVMFLLSVKYSFILQTENDKLREKLHTATVAFDVADFNFKMCVFMLNKEAP
jgi:hypothetical protein